jgi:hypothetical protein
MHGGDESLSPGGRRVGRSSSTCTRTAIMASACASSPARTLCGRSSSWTG